MATQPHLCIKEYDSIAFDVEMTDDTGKPLSLAGIDIAATLKSAAGATVSEMTVTRIDDAAGLCALFPTVPQLMPGLYHLDVLLTRGGQRVSSDTLTLHVQTAITDPTTD